MGEVQLKVLYAVKLFVEIDDGVQSCFLGVDGEVFMDGQMGEKFIDFFFAHFLGVTFVMENYVALDPPDVGLLGFIGQVAAAHVSTQLIE